MGSKVKLSTRLKSNKAFTLIELVTVMAILSILMLAGMPKFVEQSQESGVVNTRNNLLILESKVKELQALNKEKIASWPEVADINELHLKASDDTNNIYLFDKDGQIEDLSVIDSQYNPYRYIPESVVSDETMQQPNGDFLIDKNGKTFFLGEK